MQRWSELGNKHLVRDASLEGDVQVECLKSWACNMDADLQMASALLGREMEPEESLQETLQECIHKDGSSTAHLNRYLKSLQSGKSSE